MSLAPQMPLPKQLLGTHAKGAAELVLGSSDRPLY